MKFRNLFSCLLIAGLLIFSSCGKKSLAYDDAVSRIIASNEPGFMMSVNLGELLKKGGLSTKENIPMVAQMLLGEKINYLADPSTVGLDMEGKSYVGVGSDDKGPIVWLVMKIGDKDKFEKILKDEGNMKFEEIDGFNTSTEKEATMGWNGTTLLIVVTKGQDSKEAFKKAVASIKEDKKASPAYEKFISTKTDIAFFTNFDKFEDLQKHIPEGAGRKQDMEMFSRMAKKFKGSSNMFTIDFENDKIVADIVNNYNDDLKKEMDFFSKEGTPKALLTQIGSDDVNGFVAMNGEIQKGLDWIMKFVGQEDIFAEARQKSGLDVKRILESLKGNVLFSLIGIEKKEISMGKDENGEEMKFSRNMPKISVLATLNNNYIQTLCDSILKDKKTENYFSVGSEWEPAYVSFRDGIIFYTNDQAMAANTTPNAEPKLDAVAMNALAKPFSFYFNLNKIISASDDDEMTQKIAKKLKYTFGGLDMSGGHAELILDNGGKNALWTIINFSVEATANMQPQL